MKLAALLLFAVACNATPPAPAHKSEALVAPAPPPLKAPAGNTVVADDPSLPDGVCPQCRRNGATSTVTMGATTNQLVPAPAPWYDERGGLHSGDNPSTMTTTFSCSNGHTWARTRVLSTGVVVSGQ